ncbi:hypothetical protein [Actinoplanes sp. M2I2]|uniref:hypothetical protein n=1 Tax=Actinoplanes sp. M2I2 TaxID=1734444 RepID=UPI0020211CB9|nr:hypothetical protein [Actinoplanes sp. M2I2]
MKVIRFAAGLAVGYVLGSRAGREKYEQIVAAARKAQSHPAVTQAQEKAKTLLSADSGSSDSATDGQPAGTPKSSLEAAPTTSPDVTTEPAPESFEVTVPTGNAVPRPPRRSTKSTPPAAAPTVIVDPLA